MGGSQRRSEEGRWRPRPLLSFALRLASVLVPAAAGAATAYGFAATVTRPSGPAGLLWFLGLATTSTLATALAERIGRRFLPLAVLLRLSLVFPDRAPSRFAMARGAGNVRNLERRIQEARAGGVDEEPARAAQQILALVAALSAHDRKTRGHSERVRAFTDLVAGELRLGDEDRDRLRWASLLHDVGKLHVPARILNKPGKPDAREWETLKGHPTAGARIAAPLLPWLGAWGDAIEQHHERFDGGGYPNRAAGESISLAARIVSVADSFEVMTAARSYKKPMSVPAARRELAACAGGQFDPAIVRAFLNVSLGRLWWTVGPSSWTALLPVVGPVQRAGGQVVGAARATAAAIVVSAGGLVPMFAGPAAAGAAPLAAPVPAGAHAHPGSGGGLANDRGVGESGDDERDAPGDRDGSGGTDPSIDPDKDPDPGTDPGGGPGEDPEEDPEEDPDDPDLVDDTVDTVEDVVDDTVGTVEDLADDTVDVVDQVVDGTGDAVDGVVGDASDAVGGLLG